MDDALLAEELAERAGALLLQLRAAGADGRTGDAESDAFLLAELAARRPGDAVLSEEARTRPPGTPPTGSGSSTRWTAPGSSARPAGPTGPCTSRCGSAASWPAARSRCRRAARCARPGRRSRRRPGRRVRRIAVSRTRPPAWAHPVAEELGAELVPMGSAGAKVAAVLRGEVDAYVHDGGQYEWDSAAPVAVARAAGLHASRVDGSPLRYNQPDPWAPDLLVCDAGVADRVVGLIGRHRTTTEGARTR